MTTGVDGAGFAKTIAEQRLRPAAPHVDEARAFPSGGLRTILAELGGLAVPRIHGGLGGGLRDVAAVCEQLGKGCASTAICFGMHCVATAVIAAKPTPQQVERYLRPIAGGELLASLALSEPASGSHFWFPETSMRGASDGFVLNGTKSFVTSGGHADVYVVSAMATDPDAGPGDFSCLLVDGADDGLAWGPPWDGLGMRGNAARELRLDRVTVPASALLGDEGEQIWYVFNVITPYFVIAMAGTYLGIATRAAEIAADHLSERQYHHGSGPADTAVVQAGLGELWLSIVRCRALVRHAAELGDADDDDALVALCAAKADVATTAVDAVNHAMTLVGGMGYRADGELGRLLRDARAAHVMSPTTSILLTWIGRALLGRNLFAES